MQNVHTPLAERLRPKKLSEVVGQSHLVGKDGLFTKLLESGNPLPSMILWGPPGVGKTTIARLLAKESKTNFRDISAINSGVREIRATIDEAEKFGKMIVFIDEIHRFNKTQQDALLGAIEKGTIIFIGATTENPSFEVNNALLSRSKVYVLNSLSEQDLTSLLASAIKEDEILKTKHFQLQDLNYIFQFAGGDARKLLNSLETISAYFNRDEVIVINSENSKLALQENLFMFDKNGDFHYDLISAFIKSVRGSDPNAAIYYLARILQGGEKPEFVARRLIILAAEDIGLANPNALLIANAAMQAVQFIGMPEGRIPLAEATIYLATSPKSNSAYVAINMAMEEVSKSGNLTVPLALKNAPTKLMKDLGNGKDYKYAHNYDNHFVLEEYLPPKLSGKIFYQPANNSKELEIKNLLSKNWKGKYGY